MSEPAGLNILSSLFSPGQVESKERYEKFERLSEWFTWIAVVLGVLIVQLPFASDINKTMVYACVAAIVVFLVVWYRLLPDRFAGRTKSFITTLITIALIAFVVHYTGGVAGYTIFFYFLATMRVGMSMPFGHTVLASVFVIFLIFVEAFFTQGKLSTNLSLALLHSWALCLVVFYGRMEAGEASLAKEREKSIILDKERTIGKLKDEFVTIISNELKQPALATQGYLETIFTESGSVLNQEARKILELTSVNSNRLNKLLDDLLDVSQIEQGSLKIEMNDVSLKPVISEVLSNLFFDANQKKITLGQKGETDAAVKADADRLREVLTNLIGNAIKYTPEGGKVWIETKKEEEFVKILVSDNGYGMSDEAQKHLFEKFYRVESEETKTVKGSGLGLFITRQLVEKMGGEIGVVSKLGRGSTFYFTLPRYSW